jgi:hypothetical protein
MVLFTNFCFGAQSPSPDCSEKPFVKKTYFFLVWQSDSRNFGRSSCQTLEKKVFEQKLVAEGIYWLILIV